MILCRLVLVPTLWSSLYFRRPRIWKGSFVITLSNSSSNFVEPLVTSGICYFIQISHCGFEFCHLVVMAS
ncbi:hypothetical protein K1719_022835 [Acacia pycnantha]|nr:hypothetical protein K1719_022835 [Acacia pycnantha]